jgi:hypothetical protein
MVAPARTRARAVAAGGLCSDDAAPFCHNGTKQSPAMESLVDGVPGMRRWWSKDVVTAKRNP